MKVLVLGGTGIISGACTELAVARGCEVTVVNRSRRGGVAGATQIVADLSSADLAQALGPRA